MANTAKKEQPKEPAQLLRPPMLKERTIQPEGHFAVSWQHVVDDRLELADIVNPIYWVHISEKLKRDELIYAFNAKFYAQLVVLETIPAAIKDRLGNKQGGARVAVLSAIEKPQFSEKLPSFYDAFKIQEDRDGTFSILKIDHPDGPKVVESGISNRGKAQMRLDEMINTYR